MKIKSTLFLGPISLVVFAAAAPPDAEVQTDQVTITDVSDDPAIASGVVAVAVKISGEFKGGERDYFIPFMAAGQAKPLVGAECEISWQWHSGFQWMLGNGELIHAGRRVTEFHCKPDTQ